MDCKIFEDDPFKLLLVIKEKTKNPIETKKNLKAKAAKGSL